MEITGLVAGVVLMVAGVALVILGSFRAMGATPGRSLLYEVWLPFMTGTGFMVLGRWLIQ